MADRLRLRLTSRNGLFFGFRVAGRQGRTRLEIRFLILPRERCSYRGHPVDVTRSLPKIYLTCLGLGQEY